MGQRFVTHPDVRKVTFTGSTEVGKRVMAGCAEQVKRVTLELGGKSANIVFADSDIERAAATAPMSAFDNAGQDCCARSRILVERSIFDRFLELLEQAVKAVRVEDPSLESSEMGPLITAHQRDRVASYVPDDDAVAFRGSCPDGPGYWYPPTVLAPSTSPPAAFREEIFGPVVAVGALRRRGGRRSHRQRHRLRAFRFDMVPRCRQSAARCPAAVESGNLSVNSHSSVRYWTPFGGFKQSGPRAGARTRRTRFVQRGQERLYRNGGIEHARTS